MLTKHFLFRLLLLITSQISVLSYGCEVWGFMNAERIERVHRKVCKYIINVKQTTNNNAWYSELGRYPLLIERRIRIVKYWFNLIRKSENNCIVNSVYNEMKNSIANDSHNIFWLTKLKKLLEQNGFAEVWMFPDSVNVKVFIPVLKARLIDTFIVEMRNGLNTSTSMVLYRELDQTFEISPYLINLNSRKHRNSLAKLRLSSHQLFIETGRHTGVDRHNRKCFLCTKDELEDEFHFVCICPLYQELRAQYIPRYYSHPSMLKFIQLLNVSGNTLKRLSVFITQAFKTRTLAINNVQRH